MFEDFEFNPRAAAFGLIGAIGSIVVMSQVEIGLIFRIGAFAATAVACYFLVNYMFSK